MPGFSDHWIQARDYSVEDATKDLDDPAGIVVGKRNTLCYPGMPDPGVHGSGSTDKALNIHTARQELISEGAPDRVNVAFDPRGKVFWNQKNTTHLTDWKVTETDGPLAAPQNDPPS